MVSLALRNVPNQGCSAFPALHPIAGSARPNAASPFAVTDRPRIS